DRLQLAYIAGVAETEARRLKRADIDVDALTPALRRIMDRRRAESISGERAAVVLPKEMLELWGVRSALLLPLLSGDRTIGLAVLTEPAEVREFPEDQVRQAQTIAYMAAVAVEQAQTIEEERDTLRILAESFLGRPPERPGVEVA